MRLYPNVVPQQHRQWGMRMLARPGRSSLGGLSTSVEVLKGQQRVNLNWGFTSADITLSSRSDNRRRRRRKGVVCVMENSASMEPRAMEVDKLLVGDLQKAESSSSFNSKINKASKWISVVLVAGWILWRHDDHVLYFAIGSVVNGGFCKCLKYLINENRPPTADGVKEDPGMPSSHAQGFSFLATYATLALLLWQGVHAWTLISSAGILLSLAYLSWLRVAEGLHTFPQVLVGSSLGIAAASFWLWAWKAGVEAAVHSSPTAKLGLYLSFLAGFVLCYFISFKNWQFGQP